MGFTRFEFQMPEGSFPWASRQELIDRTRLTVQIDDRVELKRTFANSAEGLSYMPILRHFIEKHKAPRILEWGAGRSTLMLAEWAPQAKILSIEHNRDWFERCGQIRRLHSNTEITLQPLSLKPGESGAYVTYPLHRKDLYDVIFIDGRLRCDCAAIAKLVLVDGGVVLVHDAGRKNYAPGFSLFKSKRFVGQTAILHG